MLNRKRPKSVLSSVSLFKLQSCPNEKCPREKRHSAKARHRRKTEEKIPQSQHFHTEQTQNCRVLFHFVFDQDPDVGSYCQTTATFISCHLILLRVNKAGLLLLNEVTPLNVSSTALDPGSDFYFLVSSVISSSNFCHITVQIFLQVTQFSATQEKSVFLETLKKKNKSFFQALPAPCFGPWPKKKKKKNFTFPYR